MFMLAILFWTDNTPNIVFFWLTRTSFLTNDSRWFILLFGLTSKNIYIWYFEMTSEIKLDYIFLCNLYLILLFTVIFPLKYLKWGGGVTRKMFAKKWKDLKDKEQRNCHFFSHLRDFKFNLVWKNISDKIMHNTVRWFSFILSGEIFS